MTERWDWSIPSPTLNDGDAVFTKDLENVTITSMWCNGEELRITDGPVTVTREQKVSLRFCAPFWYLVVSWPVVGRRIWWKPWRRKRFTHSRRYRLEPT